MSDYMQEAERLIDALIHAVDIAEDQVAEDKARAALLAHIQRGAHAPAEVPMPKPVAYGFGNTAITGHTNRLMMVRIDIPGGDQYAGAFWLPLVLADEAHTYGAAREAAGYARGLKEAGQDAERYRWLRRHFAIVGTDNGAVFHALNLPTPTHIAPDAAIELDASIDAALREEVK